MYGWEFKYFKNHVNFYLRFLLWLLVKSMFNQDFLFPYQFIIYVKLKLPQNAEFKF